MSELNEKNIERLRKFVMRLKPDTARNIHTRNRDDFDNFMRTASTDALLIRARYQDMLWIRANRENTND